MTNQLKKIRGEDWLMLEQLTQDMWEDMDQPTKDSLASAIIPYKESGFDVQVYEAHLESIGYNQSLDRYKFVSNGGIPTGAVGMKHPYFE